MGKYKLPTLSAFVAWTVSACVFSVSGLLLCHGVLRALAPRGTDGISMHFLCASLLRHGVLCALVPRGTDGISMHFLCAWLDAVPWCAVRPCTAWHGRYKYAFSLCLPD